MNDSAVLWIRVSSEGQSHGYSPDSQERLLKDAAAKYDVLETYRITESAKVSENRRQFKEMVEFVKANAVGHIVALSQDRLGRGYKDFYTIQSLIDDNDVSIELVEPNKSINQRSSIADRFMFQVMAALAEADNRKRAADTRRGMEEKARQGGVPHLASIGYLNAPDPADPKGERKIVVKDEARAPLVVWAFKTYEKGGYSLATLRDELNRRKLTTKSGRPISIHGLQVILGNRFYLGEFKWSGKTWPGTHEPLISPELFDQVQARLHANRTYSKPAAKKWFPFKKFLRCGYCHSAICGEEKSGRHDKGLYHYYRCTYARLRQDRNWYKKKFGTNLCPQKRWTEAEIGRLIEDAMGKFYVDDFIAEKVRERLKTAHVEEEAFERKESRRLLSEQTRKKNHLDLLYQDRLDGTITKEEYMEKAAAIKAELDRIQLDMAKLNTRNFHYKEQGSQVLELLKGMKDVYHNADLKGKEKILEVMLDHITLRDEPFFYWQPPFDTLFDLGELFLTKKEWGE
ncbi:MAG: recombinase family protein [Candidatus Aminicenantales bacterium]